MIDLNNIEVIGHVAGDEVILRHTPNGKPVVNFTVAYNHRWTQDGETKEKTEWFRVTVWNRLAEICSQRIVKGMSLFVAGRVELEQWENQDGVNRSRLSIIANRVIFLSGGKLGGNTEEIETEPEDIPF